MSETKHPYEIVIDLVLEAPREKIYRCWTTPELLKQWFAPKPWTTPFAEMDVRPGGASNIVMRSPEGQDMENPGLFLAVEPNRRLVFTDAFAPGWRPAGKPFMVGEIVLEDAGPGKTRYLARAMHWNAADRDAHEKMGFTQGWTQCAHQLEALAKTI